MRFDQWLEGLIVAVITGVCQTIAADLTILERPTWWKLGKIFIICFVINWPLYLRTHPLKLNANQEEKDEQKATVS